jgi:flavodoxin-like protein
MRTVIVYESMYGNTRQVAEAIRDGLAGTDALVVPVGNASPALVSTADLLVVGGPTHAFGMSRPQTRSQAVHDADRPGKQLTVEPGADGIGIREWLETAELTGRLVAAFDTRVRMPCFNAHAAPKAGRAVAARGGTLVRPPESFFVTKQNILVPGELERARQWGADLRACATAARTTSA